MSQPPAASGPDFQGPRFAACYLHPDRQTGISCQRCGRPICGACMQPASVGFQCPRCVGAGKASSRAPRTAFGGALTNSSAPMTKLLIGVLAAVWLLDLVSRGLLSNLLVLYNAGVGEGQFWRLLTYGFTTSGIFHLAMSALVLWIAGRAVEDLLGGWRFLALFVLAGLGGATCLFLIGPPMLVAAGASSSVIGLLAANGILKYRRREDIRGDIGLLILLVLYSLVVSFASFGWVGQVGGIAVGALTGFVLAFAPRERRTLYQTIGLIGVFGLCVVAVAARFALG